MNAIKKPVNIVDVTYARTGASVNTDAMGMREMQQRVFAKRDAQHLLVKAPPASGKSRALMFVALDKLYNQGRKKVIVAVPERSIGASFSSTSLTTFGFFADWEVKPEHNLCDPGSSQGKVGAFIDFLNGPDAVLVCTHATLRFAFEKLAPDAFNGTVLAIDEFHHVSADIETSRLGALLRDVMNGSDVHIVAMTGSYFRGDSVPVLSAEDEARFTPVTFNYYDQLNGYEHLHSLGIGHHFYQGRYTDAIGEVFDLDKKTIIHIPNVNSGESTKDKIEEVGFIIDSIGHVESTDPDTGIISIRRADTGAILRLADLVDDTDQKKRADTLHYLSTVASKDRDAVDVILALGMAKEGFDWPFAEHALTVGYRASLTEVIQIIGRVTRDSPGKEHAQFTNLIAEPDASQGEVKVSVNNMLKAITASLLMEQVLAQNFEFKTKRTGDDEPTPPGVIKIKGFKEPVDGAGQADRRDRPQRPEGDDPAGRHLREGRRRLGGPGDDEQGADPEDHPRAVPRPGRVAGRGAAPAGRRGLGDQERRGPRGRRQAVHQDVREVRQHRRHQHQPDRLGQPVPAGLRGHLQVGHAVGAADHLRRDHGDPGRDHRGGGAGGVAEDPAVGQGQRPQAERALRGADREALRRGAAVPADERSRSATQPQRATQMADEA